MNIQDILKKTGKAAVKDYGDGVDANYVKIHSEKGILYWYDKITNEEKGPVAFHVQHEEVWQPYPNKKEIRPEKAGELWMYLGNFYPHIVVKNQIDRLNILFTGYFDMTGPTKANLDEVIHNQNGWTRIFPVVDDVGRIEIEGVRWEIWDNAVIPRLSGFTFSKFLGNPPMKMILEIPKEGE